VATRERTLTQRDLNRALLARQLLLERARLPLPRALERIGGIQAQYAPSMYIGLWSRLEGFEREQLTAALERRTVVQGTLMRATIHLVSARDYWPFALGVRQGRRDWWLRVQRQPPVDEITAAAARIGALLADGPRHRKELLAGLGTDAFNGAGLWIDLVRTPPSGTWEQRRADRFALAEAWVGPETGTPEEGGRRLVRSYLGGFGPAAPAEIADWAGLTVGDVADVLDRLSLRRFRDEQGRVLVDLPRAPLPGAAVRAPVRFLPTWDATLLVHARRTGIVPEPVRPLIFTTKNPQSVRTFLVDGVVAGTWRVEEGRVKVEPFEPLARGVRREVEDEAARIAAFVR
jgi:hypothetical protein